MRLVIGTVVFLTMAACPALANEAFIAQLTSKVATTEQSSAHSMKTMLSAAMLALPLQPKAINSPAVNASTNTSAVVQIGTNNIAAVSQTGSGNASSVVQHGDRKSTRLNSSHLKLSRMPSSA